MGSPLSAAGGLFADVNANPPANLTTVTVQPASRFCFLRVEPKGSRFHRSRDEDEVRGVAEMVVPSYRRVLSSRDASFG